MYFEILINETNQSNDSEVKLRLGTEQATRSYSHGSKLFDFEHPIEIKDIANENQNGSVINLQNKIKSLLDKAKIK